ncbi:MAG: cyclase family protein [Microthrixaceae bacterium]
MPLPGELADLADEVRTWGRWGDDDELGCGNLLDDASARRGAESIKSAQRVSLAVDLRADGIQVGQPARRYNPILTHTSINERDPHAPGIWEGTDDLVTMSTCAGTHLDALSHISYDGKLYNGFDRDEITPFHGAQKLGAEKLPTIATRGVLLDVARAKGVDGLDELDQGYAITGDDLAEAAELAKVDISPGDFVMVRTGEMRHYLADERTPMEPIQNTLRWRYAVGTGEAKLPGLSTHSIRWLRENDVAGAVDDAYAYEVFPPTMDDWSDCLAVHMIQVRDMGLIQGQNWNLEELSVACAERGSGAFMLVAAPEPFTGATSTPVAPVAVL